MAGPPALATPEWIGTAENLVVAGPPGTVKSHMDPAKPSDHTGTVRDVTTIPARA